MSDTPKTDKIIELVEELFMEARHVKYLESKDLFTKKEMGEVGDLIAAASFVVGSIDLIREGCEAVELSTLGE